MKGQTNQSRNARQAPAVHNVLVALLACGLGGLACSGRGAESDTQAKPQAPSEGDAIERTTELGPVKATVRLTPAKPTLGDPLTLTLTVEAQSGVEVEMPSFGEALGRFQITQFVPREELRDGKRIASQTYTLQAPMSGKQRIPPLSIEFLDERQNRPDQAQAQAQAGQDPAKPGTQAAPAAPDPAASGQAPSQAPGQAPSQADDTEAQELLTEELALEVASLLPEGAVADELKGPRGALDASAERPLWQSVWLWLIIGVLAAAGGLVGFRAWRSAARTKIRVSAYDVAISRLSQLEARGLPGPEDADTWYVELSGIIRRYLEDRYSLRAPELTTEEFLHEARRSGVISTQHRELLSAFLINCDRVKFARYAPNDTESTEALDTARRFLGETRLMSQPQTGAQDTAQAA